MHSILKRDDRGATAVEYAIVAGLIALGVIGSLVSTKTSLNSVFGRAASHLSAGASNVSSVTALAIWGSKTLVSRERSVVSMGGDFDEEGPSGYQATTTYKFSDGSKVSYNEILDENSKVVSEFIRTRDTTYDSNREFIYKSGQSGSQSEFQVLTYSPGSNYSTLVSLSTQSGSSSTQTNFSCSGNGSCTNVGTAAPSEEFRAMNARIISQFEYFKEQSRSPS